MNVVESALAFIAPHDCLVCKKEGRLVCAWCRPDLPMSVPSRCYRCQAQTKDWAVCPKCMPRTSVRHMWVASEYTATPKSLIQSLKYQYKREAAQIIADYLDELLPALDSQTVVVHVPTANVRVRQRSFDHAKLIAKNFARNRKLSCSSALLRRGSSRQVGSKREQRKSQLEDAFLAYNAETIKGRTILLIDDVVTTGATLESAAKVIKRAGARRVDAAVFCQAI